MLLSTGIHITDDQAAAPAIENTEIIIDQICAAT